ncbi:MAG TPA: lipocalin-like domain-containing protein [Acidimicrobiales bacterium]|nr:lipocalin-like domain-containing protein [Acidimicrobiales bacterium]
MTAVPSTGPGAAGELVGAWTLTRWDYTVDGEPRGFPLGEDAEGQIIYSPEGHMSAILMQAQRPAFDQPQFHQGTPEQREVAALTYVSYGGTYELRGDVVVHHVAYALFPDWIGTDLVREVSWQGDELVLTALPETSRTGKVVVNRLFWARAG